MGVVDFDPEKWSRSNGSEDGPDVAKVARLARLEGNNAEHSQLSQLSQADALPIDVRAGLDGLRLLPTPRKTNPSVWKAAVFDSLRLASEGWATKALALGWAPVELFGVVPALEGDPAADGLAVWLQGRRVLAICATHAAVEETAGRAYYNRRQASGAVLIWDIAGSDRKPTGRTIACSAPTSRGAFSTDKD